MDVAASDLTSRIVLQRSSAEKAEDFAEGRARAISVHATTVLLSGLITFNTAWLRARIFWIEICAFRHTRASCCDARFGSLADVSLDGFGA